MYIDIQKLSGRKVAKLTLITFGKEEGKNKMRQLSKKTCNLIFTKIKYMGKSGGHFSIKMAYSDATLIWN